MDGHGEPGRNYAGGNRGLSGTRESPRSAGNPGGQLVRQAPPGDAGNEREPAARPARRGRQRSIRSTVTMLLIIPLVTLTGLLAFTFTKTVPGALANHANTVTNDDIGRPLQNLLTALNAEELQTYTLGNLKAALKSQQSMSPAQRARMAASMPASELASKQARLKQAQGEARTLAKQVTGLRGRTDSAVSAYRSGQAKLDASGILAPRTRSLVAGLLTRLKGIPALRAEADSGAASPLTVLQGYTGVIRAIFPYIGSSANADASIPVFGQAMGTLYMGEALTDVATEAALGGGALASGGTVTAPVYRLFTQTVDQQRDREQTALTQLGFERNFGADPYARALNSPQFKSFQSLENQVIAAGPGQRLPVGQQVWQQQATTALGMLQQGATSERETVTKNAQHDSDMSLYALVGVSGLGLLLVLLSSLLLLRFGNRTSRELRGLRAAARSLAFRRLPDVVGRLRAGEHLDTGAEAPPLDLRTRTREVTETADAFSAVQLTAVQAAIEQARLRNAVSSVFRRLARRNQGLLQRQLKMLDEMERGTHDPDALGQLFRLDHLTTRMRRQAEGLIILSGAPPGRGWRQPVQVVEVLRGAVGEIEDYVRVDLVTDSPDYLQGASVADVTHLLAELIENAVAYSPPASRVQVRGGRVANGYVVEVEDRGLGVPAGKLAALNQRLAEPPDFDLADSDQLGLFVVSRLAARHGIGVSLHSSLSRGVRAIVLLPHSLVVSPQEAAQLASQESAGARGGEPSENTGNMHRGLAAAVLGRQRDRAASTPFPAVSGPVADASGAMTAADGIPRAGAYLDGNGEDPGILPRRDRMASLPPQLRRGGPAAARNPAVPRRPSAPKSPEQARTLMSSIQNGLRTGRSADGTWPPGPYGSSQPEGPGGNGPDGRTR